MKQNDSEYFRRRQYNLKSKDLLCWHLHTYVLWFFLFDFLGKYTLTHVLIRNCCVVITYLFGWGSIWEGILLFQHLFLTGVLSIFSWDGAVIKTGALIELIQCDFEQKIWFTYIHVHSTYALLSTIYLKSQSYLDILDKYKEIHL